MIPLPAVADDQADATRADVEAALRRLIDGAVAGPCAIAASLAGKLTSPLQVARTVVDLAVAGFKGDQPASRPAPVTLPSRTSPPGADVPPPDREAPRSSNASSAIDDNGEAPAATDLPIAEYESLAASQVIARLGRLTTGELQQVAAFEAAHRGRRTVLGKIDQLTARGA